MVSYYRHNTDTSGAAVLERLLAGENCALVTDAGTPAVSDPGEDLVAQCAAAGVPVVAIPGPCALVTALAVSGLPTGRFTFEGFLAMNKKNRRAHLEELKSEQRTMIFYEAPHKLTATLRDLREAFGAERRISLCRELSKLHEEIRRTTLGEAGMGKIRRRGNSFWSWRGAVRGRRKSRRWNRGWRVSDSFWGRGTPDGMQCGRQLKSWRFPGMLFMRHLWRKSHKSFSKRTLICYFITPIYTYSIGIKKYHAYIITRLYKE